MKIINYFNNHNNRIIQTETGKKYKKPDFKTQTEAIYSGFSSAIGTGILLSLGAGIVSKNITKETQKQNSKILYNAAINAYKASPLKNTNMHIYNLVDLDIDKIKPNFPKWTKFIPFSKSLLKLSYKKRLKIVKEGKNAFYAMNKHSIFINIPKRATSLFHEMGHALDKKTSTIGKFLLKLRMQNSLMTPLLLSVTLLKRKKMNDEKPVGIFDKVTTLVKNNIVPISLASSLPVLTEEAMASIKGIKMAKGHLLDKDIKTLKKLYALSWSTYLMKSIYQAAMLYTASRVKDRMSEPKPIIDDKSLSLP